MKTTLQLQPQDLVDAMWLHMRPRPVMRALLLGIMMWWVGAAAAPDVTKPEARTPGTAVDEILRLLDRADTASQNKDSLETCLVTLTSVGSMLDTFEMEFGLQPETAPGFEKVESKAKAMLESFDQLSKGGIYFNQDSADTSACILLELAGRSKDALKRLSNVKPGGGCGNWQATVMQSVNELKSGIYQRRGKYAKALSLLKAAMSLDGLSLYTPRRDLTLARYAFLLAKTGNEKEAVKNYQLVVDLFPNTTGWTISKRALQENKAFIEPTAARLNDMYLKVKMVTDKEGIVRKRYLAYHEEAVLALGGHRFPESFELLEKMVAEAGRDRELACVTRSLAELGDKQALPLLHAIEKEDNQFAKFYAASALHELGDDSWVEPFITYFGTQKNTFELEWADDTLRNACGGGPDPKARWNTKPAEFARLWFEWIANQKDKKPAAATL